MRLLFVCVGNTCRSQMAEALAKEMGFEAQSAGTHPGKEIAENAVKVIEELGFQMKGQFPKSINSIETNKYDKIISMGCGVECPNLPISTDWGLDDPVGNDIDFYRNTRDLIMQKLEKLSDSTTLHECSVVVITGRCQRLNPGSNPGTRTKSINF